MELVLFLLLVNAQIYCGNCCSISKKSPVTRITDNDDTKESFEDLRKCHIARTVENLPLSQILVLHKRTRTADYDRYSLNSEERVYFRECIARRYEQNRNEIDTMGAESDNKYRNAVLAPKAHVIHLRRKNKRKTMQDKLPSNVATELNQESNENV